MLKNLWLEECSAGTTRTPEFSICCAKGTVQLPLIQPVPQVVRFIASDTNKGNRFLPHIRRYNTALSFASKGVNIDPWYADGRQGNYTFSERETVKFSQIYLHDPHEQLGIYGQLDRQAVEDFQSILEAINPLCQLYKSIRQREHGMNIEELCIVMKSKKGVRGELLRPYDLPSAPEIAILMPDAEAAVGRDVVVVEGKNGPCGANAGGVIQEQEAKGDKELIGEALGPEENHADDNEDQNEARTKYITAL
ncbi:hypothetical protein EDD21DRAFT_415289 [Dissophora ornata]|nr:hypothetical protein EDD21DRAFT_415289 [Dissophora ornata]